MKLQYVIAIHLMKWLTNFSDFSFKWTATAAIGIHSDCHSWWISKVQSGRDTLEERYAIKFCFKLGKMPKKGMECFILLLEHLTWIEHKFLSGIRDSRKAGSLWGMMRGVGGVRKSDHQSWLAKGLGLGFLCWGFKVSSGRDSVRRGQHPSNRVSGISPSPQLYRCRRLFDQDGIKTVTQPPYSPDLGPCDFWLFPKLRGCRYETIEEMKEAVMKVIDTRGLPWGLPEVVGTE